MKWRIGALWLLAFPFSAAALGAPKGVKWVEARSPHFLVVTRESEGTARQVARTAEQVRAAFQAVFPGLRLDPPSSITILPVRGEQNYRELVPEFWEKKGLVHPSGIFACDPDRSFIAIRLDAPGGELSHLLAHEYAHLFLRFNSSALPLWLDEGLAEFFATLKVGTQEAQMGLANSKYLASLREEGLLPLDAVLSADAASPYYNLPKYAGRFYAQSWLLAHYLVLGDTGGAPNRLNVLLGLLAEGIEARTAEQQVLGNPPAAQAALVAYLRDPSLKLIRVRLAEDAARGEVSLREMPPAESAAVRGLFFIDQERPKEARALLEEALRQDPRSSAAVEGMGILALREHRNDEAATWFGRAVALDSPSFVPYYYHAAFRLRAPLDAEASAQVERELRRTLELNPDYAPACEALASFYHGRGENSEQALALARHAVELEPRVAGHKLVLASILLAMHRPLEAKLAAQSILDSSSSEDERAAARALLAAARSTEKRPDVQLGPDGQVTSPVAPSQAAVGGKTARASGKPAAKSSPSQGAAGRKAAQPRLLSAEGKILNVTCSSPAAMDLKLVTTKGTLTLHTDNYFHVDFLASRWKPPDPFRPCEHIQGHAARVRYAAAREQGYQGVFSSVEVLK